MITSEDIKFETRPFIINGIRIGDDIIGRLVLGEILRVTAVERRMARFNLDEYAKERIRKSIWDKLYREIHQGVIELGYHAMRSASRPHDSIKAKELFDSVNAKLHVMMNAKL